MKKISIFIFLIFFAPFTALGDADQDFNDAVWKSMVKQFEKTVEQQAMQKVVTVAVENMVSAQAAGYVAPGFALLTIPGNVHDYNNANSETERFNATASAVAAVWMAVNPAIGFIVELGVLGMQIQSAMISKFYMKKNLEIVADITALYAEVSEIDKEKALADLGRFTHLTSQMALASGIMDQLQKRNDQICNNDVTSGNPKATFECLENGQAILYWANFNHVLLGSLLNFQSIYFSVERAFQLMNWDLPSTQKLYSSSQEALIAKQNELDQVTGQFLDWLNQNLLASEDDGTRALSQALSCRDNLAPVYGDLNHQWATLKTGKFDFPEDRDFLMSDFSQKLIVAGRLEKVFCKTGLPDDLKENKILLSQFSTSD